jgi:hypothetical protein
MNVFATDHPLVSDSSHRHTWKASVLVVAAMLYPFLMGLLCLINGITTEDTTDYDPPAPFWEVLVGAVFYSLIIAVVLVVLCRLGCWIASSPKSRTQLRKSNGR